VWRLKSSWKLAEEEQLVSTQALAEGLRMRLVLYLCLSMLANSCLLRRSR
jgi:hypothetical protein